MQRDPFPADVRLRCIDPAKNKRRFYVMKIQPNLFGEWELVREWGRIGAGGRVRWDAYPSAGLALDALLGLQQIKSQRGYRNELFIQLEDIVHRTTPAVERHNRALPGPEAQDIV